MLFDRARRVTLVHAHPDDETLATGALIRALAERGIEVDVITCTRGEAGEVVEGVLPPGTSVPELTRVRLDELDAALTALGVSEGALLGVPPASRDGEVHVHRDSGMVWVRDGLAGPAPDTGEDAFSRQPPEALVADLVAWLEHRRPDVLVSYDEGGGYGHPDHVRAHEISRAAATRLGLVFAEVVEDEALAGDDLEWVEAPPAMDELLVAHDSYRTQFTREGDRIVHVGGQAKPLVTRVALRPA